MDRTALSLELARRIERIVPRGDLADADRDPDQIQSQRFGETIAIRSIGGRPRNNVYCFGPVDRDRLPDILAFYHSKGVAPRFFLSPAGFTPEIGAALDAAGFRQQAFEQAILYGIPAPALPSDITIERVSPDTLDEYVETSAAAWEWPATWRNGAKMDLRARYTVDCLWFLARIEGTAAGVGSLAIDDDGVTRLSGTAVLPKFRRRGCHQALITYRLSLAFDCGCDLVVGSAVYGSTSFQNQQRAGLRLAYVESEWGRER